MMDDEPRSPDRKEAFNQQIEIAGFETVKVRRMNRTQCELILWASYYFGAFQKVLYIESLLNVLRVLLDYFNRSLPQAGRTTTFKYLKLTIQNLSLRGRVWNRHSTVFPKNRLRPRCH